MKLTSFCIIFTVFAIWAQYIFPSMDFFSPGLVVMLQFGLFKPALWAGLVWMFIQEGTGGLAFGTMILFYLGFVIFFSIGGIFLEVGNILFTMLLFLFLTIFQALVVSVMASLQGLVLSGQYSIKGFLIQAGMYFLVWFITYNLFRKYYINEPAKGRQYI